MPQVQDPSRQTLDQVPGRVLTFVLAVSTSAPIRAALATKGYSQKEHQYAWGLLQELSGTLPTSPVPTADRAVQEALVELDRWDEPNFTFIEAILQRSSPQQAAFVFENLEAKEGPASVVGVQTLLDRLDALEKGDDRKATRKADHAALEALAERGYTKEERKRLRALVDTAKSVVAVAPVSDEQRTKIQLALYRWLMEWTAAARLVITRRDHLIRLGLAKRKKAARRKDEPAQPAAKPGGGEPPKDGAPPAG